MKREKFSPAVGDEYINQGNGSIFRCIKCLEEPGTAILQNTESGWTFKATGLDDAHLETALCASFKKKPQLVEKNRDLLHRAEAALLNN